VETNQTDVALGVYSSFDAILDVSFGKLEKKQADIVLRRIEKMEKTLSELEESLVAALEEHRQEDIP
jgi:phage shock protein A